MNQSAKNPKEQLFGSIIYLFLFFQLELKQLDAGFLKCVTKIAMP